MNYFLKRLKEKIWLWFIWKLPKSLVYWSVIRVWANGTIGEYGNTHPDDLSWSEALKRFEKKK